MNNKSIFEENYSERPTDEIYKKGTLHFFSPQLIVLYQVKTFDSTVANQLSCSSLFMEATKDSSELLSNENSQSNDEMIGYNKLELSTQVNEYRKSFYHFLSLIKNEEEIVKHYNSLFQKNLSSNFRNVLSCSELSDSFEKQLFKLAKTSRHSRKNWSEEDVQMLISFVAYFCGVFSLDHNDLVTLNYFL